MIFDVISLGDHLPEPATRRYIESQSERFKLWVELGIRAEQLGYGGIWLGEHHCSDYILSSPQMVLAAIATQTSRIRLGTGVSLLPNNDPVRVAEDFATLDLLSDGRAEIGFGSGITPHTFALFGQNAEHSKEMASENLDLLQKLWNERRIDWKGKFRSAIHESQVQPRTFSGKSIPINRATITNVEVAIDAGHQGHKLMLLTAFGVGPKQRDIADVYRDAYRSAGHDPAGMSIATVGYVHVGTDREAACTRWLPYRGNYQHFVASLAESKGGTKSLLDYLNGKDVRPYEQSDLDFCGSPQEVADKLISMYQALNGFDRFMAYFDLGGLPREEVLRSMDLFAAGVMPRVCSALKLPV